MSILNFIKCKLGKHELASIDAISDQSERMRCVNCCREFAVNHTERLVIPWDEDLEEFYNNLDELRRSFEIDNEQTEKNASTAGQGNT